MARVALVAGASSGLGRAVAARLAMDGYVTYAGARSFASGVPAPQGCVPVVLDVTDDASVRAAVSRIAAEAGGLDVLVNCAAFLTLGSCEDTSIDELRAVMETNYLGMARMTQAVLPGMRARGGGRIVQFSSLNGLFGIPFQGAYVASKHAIEGFSDALAMEARAFGVKVIVVAPGDCCDSGQAYRTKAGAARAESSAYLRHYQAVVDKILRDESHGQSPALVARAVSRALSKKIPPARVVVAKPDQRLAMWLHDILPGRLFRWIIGLYYAQPKENDK